MFISSCYCCCWRLWREEQQ